MYSLGTYLKVVSTVRVITTVDFIGTVSGVQFMAGTVPIKRRLKYSYPVQLFL